MTWYKKSTSKVNVQSVAVWNADYHVGIDVLDTIDNFIAALWFSKICHNVGWSIYMFDTVRTIIALAQFWYRLRWEKYNTMSQGVSEVVSVPFYYLAISDSIPEPPHLSKREETAV